MTEKYVAPTTGHEIVVNEHGGMTVTQPGMIYVPGHEPTKLVPGRVQSLREFFRDERDKELRRWRWPENPSYVVYELTQDRVRVVDEVTGLVNDINRDTSPTRSDHSPGAAKAYFDAHPLPKPWHDAKPGDTWVITTTFHPGEFAVIATTEGELQSANGFCYDPTDKSIISGERIWERK